MGKGRTIGIFRKILYSVARISVSRGVVRVNLDGEREYANNAYRYWHCYPSADNNWVAADTQNGSFSEIVYKYEYV